ncbi:Glycerophosphoryl diester phosphodiesterase family-domain-containing protein [Bombardia bombarda]|uniref:Glycerophosphoryl diester phosphodiesterase family-domain-containing protein n=1 Tax=Bombardia bombarda TaxID=252184 RepID=A0AA40CEN0_9PEZI|nr:Glycerophosphoryl diester phosphodiesterase family-domain-containing protein [Bombardia bombarda]
MKFGKHLSRNQVPEWAASYINYKGLKKLIKAVAETARNGAQVDLAEFFFDLDRNLEDVDSFYNKKYAEACRRHNVLQDRYGTTPDVVANLDGDEVEELSGALLDLRNQLRNLQWFGEMNRKGFVKITKKLDKKVPSNTTTQHRYVSTKVDTRPFANDTTIAALLSEVNKWISVVGEAQHADHTASQPSTRPLGRASAKAMLGTPPALLDKLNQAIRKDDVDGLKSRLEEGNISSSDPSWQGMLLNLLQRSISARSRNCIAFLLENVSSLQDPDDINQRNCIHRLVIHIGRTKTASSNKSDAEGGSFPFPGAAHYVQPYLTPATSPLPTPRASNLKESNLLGNDDEAVQMLQFLLENLKPGQRAALSAGDIFGRTPLHYAAQFGFVVVCQLIMSKMQAWGQFNVEHGIDAPEWQDKDGNAPLHLSVLGGHPLTTKALLQAENWKGVSGNKAEMRRGISKSSAVLAIATKANFKLIVKMLVDAGVDINWQDKAGETALHIAARFGHDECARVLLQGTAQQKANLGLTEKAFAWTPLHIAAVDGHLSVAQLLVDAGADVDKPDSSGWTAKEHAALRGHLAIARLVAAYSQASDETAASSSDDEKLTTETPPPEVASLEDRRSKNGSSRPAEPVKTFGHRYLKNESLVLVSLGSMDMRQDSEAVSLDRVPLNEAHTTQLDTALSVVVSAHGAHGEPSVIDLPVHENISTEPIAFTTADPSKVQLFFDIVPTYSGNEKHKIARGVALLKSVRPTIGAKRMNLQTDICVPIMAKNFEVIGTVKFNFLVITPFSHPKMEVTSRQTYWKKLTGPMVIGHRGMGKNLTSNRSLQLGENTVPSFIAAASLGAQYVEFDVQLTKDHVPVIYHDFLVSETGFDAPVHTLTLEQFLHINPGNKHSKQHSKQHNNNTNISSSTSPSSKAPNKQLQKFRSNSPGPRQRSMSMDHHPVKEYGQHADMMSERMKHTRDFKVKGFKANSRGNFIQAPFATLEDLFHQLPESIGFNIEMKYPMLHESEEHEMDTYAVELNSFCDTVLTKVYDMAADRPIIFSSFNPDICLCLSFKQPSIPILFLTDAGSCPVGDIRASSLQEAIRFASRWNLLGIVSHAEVFCNSPRLVKVVKQSGLVCVSYGTQNNKPELVQRQVKEGIDAVIVDSVLAIRKGLTNMDQEKEKAKVTGQKNGAGGGGGSTSNSNSVVNPLE